MEQSPSNTTFGKESCPKVENWSCTDTGGRPDLARRPRHVHPGLHKESPHTVMSEPPHPGQPPRASSSLEAGVNTTVGQPENTQFESLPWSDKNTWENIFQIRFPHLSPSLTHKSCSFFDLSPPPQSLLPLAQTPNLLPYNHRGLPYPFCSLSFSYQIALPFFSQVILIFPSRNPAGHSTLQQEFGQGLLNPEVAGGRAHGKKRGWGAQKVLTFHPHGQGS